ncbi:MAG: Gfo/Idh/MocA family oxidoreductase [Polyangiaceae bacterium]
MKDRSRAVICGAGAAGLVHAITYRAAGVDVVGLHDPDPGRLNTLAEMTGARVCESPAELFAMDCDFVSICSPPAAHVRQATLATNGKRTVFVEKPVATTRVDLDRIAGLRDCAPVVQWRAGRAIRAIRSAMQQGLFGSSPEVTADLEWGRDEAYFAAGRATLGGWGCGVLLSVGIHAIDAICWALGRPLLESHGVLGHRPGLEVETTALATLRFYGGARATVRATFDGTSDSTSISFSGNGITAVIQGAELDPTASRVAWSASDPGVLESLRAIELASSGGLERPLIVPFLHAAIASAREGARPGETPALPSIGSTLDAHRAILDVYAAATSRPSLPLPTSPAARSFG